MDRRGLGLVWSGCFLLVSGCAQTGRIRWPQPPERPSTSARANPIDRALKPARLDWEAGDPKPLTEKAAAPTAPVPIATDDSSSAAGVWSLDASIREALESNPTVRAARLNVQAVRYRIPQVTALDDPILSNTIFPIPSVAPQYSLMGYMPYGALIAQQFPWWGTLRLRGQAAEHDARIAIQELAATELDVVAGVKRAYYDLHYYERAVELLGQNRGLATRFLRIARERYVLSTATQVDVLRAEVAVSDVDREIENTRRSEIEARSELARLLHREPGTEIRTEPELAAIATPTERERLEQLAAAVRPELQGRREAIDRDHTAVELARKRYYPNLTLGLVYQQMDKTNAMTPMTAGGMPNVGLFVGMNLPVYRKKLAAGVCEAQARAAAEAQLYEAEKDQVRRDINDAFAQLKTQENVLALLRRNNRPAASRILELTEADYRAGKAGVDYLSLVAAWREQLQVELQIAQLEAEVGKSLAVLERAVGSQLNENPPDPKAIAPAPTSTDAPAPAPAASGSPFRPEPSR